jgi:hypothetical protein
MRKVWSGILKGVAGLGIGLELGEYTSAQYARLN